MSNDLIAARHSALTLAVQFGCTEDVTTILHNAGLFLSFLNRGDDASTSASAKTSPSSAPATKAAPQSATKPASGSKSTASEKVKAASKPAPEPEPEVEEDTPLVITDREVGEALGAMLAADKREEAVALMGKFGAKSKSTLDKKFYAAFVAQANEILLTA